MTFASPQPGPRFTPSFSTPFYFNETSLTYGWAGIALVIALITYGTLSKGDYDAIPAIGGTNLWSSYAGALRFVTQARDMVQLGYDKYTSGAFRIPQLQGWLVIVSGEMLVNELGRAPDDTLSFNAGIEEILPTKHLIGPSITDNPYHVGLIREQLNRNLGTLFSALRDEIMHAFEDNVPPTDAWEKVPAYNTVLQIVARASNRIFVGAPLCRNPEYTGLNIKFTIDVNKARFILMWFPSFLKPLAARMLTNVPKSIQLGMKHLKPLIEERQRNIDEYGSNYPDKPNDLLSWMMDEAEGEERTPRLLTNRILSLNFAAIHTSSMSFTHALLHLAAQPEYLGPIREEIEGIVAEDGWTKVALTRMHKLDSFLKESQRLNGTGSVSMTRKALKAFTFSDGTRIPKGALVSAAARPMHHDDKLYINGDTFDGFRFSKIREQDGQATTNQFVATRRDYIPFGHGRHACPGRFFAANELKAMMAHLIMTYDIKLEKGGQRPANQWIGTACLPNMKAEVMFRQRQT